MKTYKLWLLAPLLFGLSGCGSDNNNNNNSNTPQFSDRTLRDLETAVGEKYRELGVPGLLVGLWVPGVGEWTQSYGVSDLDTQAPMRFDQHVRIGSVTKTYTVTLILQLHDDGLLNIHDPVSKYFGTDPASGKIVLENAIPNADRITLRHMANLTSGIASYTADPDFQDQVFNNNQRQWQPLELVNIGIANTVAGCPYAPTACFEPGENWFYSNTNAVMLSLIVEHVTGKSYREVLHERILAPLGLQETDQPVDNTIPQPFAQGYTFQGRDDNVLQNATNWNPSWGFGVGDLTSDFEDLRIWGRAVGRGDLLKPETQALRQEQVSVGGHQPGVRAYAVGIGYNQGWWGHGGELPGYNSMTFYRPDIDAVMVVIANSDELEDGAHPAYFVGDVIIDIAARESPLLEDFDPDVPFINDPFSPED